MTRIGVISDLHLYSRRSTFARYRAAIERTAGRCDLFVLNGDIFDFRWSTLPTSADTCARAAAWVQDLARRHPHCRFQYVMGNHDYVRIFLDRMEETAAATENLALHRSHFRFGERLFLHGEAVTAGCSPEAVEACRRKSLDEAGRGPVGHRAYDVVTLLRLHRVVFWLYPRDMVCRRLAAYLDAVDPALRPSLGHVYFGHTHIGFSGHVYDGLTFHNTGAAVAGLELNMLETQADGEA